MNNIWDDFYNEKPPKKQRIVLANSSKKRIEYNSRYNKNNTVTVLVRLNKNTESELIEYLESIKSQGGSKSGFLKMAAKCYIFEISKKNP